MSMKTNTDFTQYTFSQCCVTRGAGFHDNGLYDLFKLLKWMLMFKSMELVRLLVAQAFIKPKVIVKKMYNVAKDF